jgi:hypothetical protein
MPRKYNFGAGPATMPEAVLKEVQDELLDWNGLGLSVMEISHRSPEFIEIAKQAEQDFRDLLSISEDFAVLFTHGGATMQNAMIMLTAVTGPSALLRKLRDIPMSTSQLLPRKKSSDFFQNKSLGNSLRILRMYITLLTKPLEVYV